MSFEKGMRKVSRLLGLVVVCGVALVMAKDSPPSLAVPGTAESRTVIACFHEKVSRFTAQAHPGRCDIWGNRGTQFAGIPVRGMKWGHWGANPTRADYGVDTRNDTRVRIVAYRPIACDEGRTWYSRVVVAFPADGKFFELRLPTCDGPSVIG
jgi:hypothetical protein